MPRSDDAIPAGVQVRQTLDGVRYALPRRELGVIGQIAWPVALIAGAVAVIPTIVAAALVVSASRGGSSPAGTIGAVAFALVCLVAASPVCSIALAAAIGRTEIDVTKTRIRRLERAGPLRWGRAIAVDTVNALAMRSSGGEPGALRDIGGITALCGSDLTKRAVAIGYPASVLAPITREIGAFLGVPVEIDRDARMRDDEDDLLGDAPHEGALDGVPLYAPTDPPKGSRAHVTRADGELSIRLDARGLWKTKGIFPFAVIWNVFVLAVGGLLMYSAVWGRGGFGAIGFGGLVLSVFLIVGVFVMYWGIRLGTRRAIIDVVGDGLLITQKTAFGDEQHTWTGDQIRTIRVGPSGTKVNDEPVLELQVRVRLGSGATDKHGFFMERDDPVLEWIAAELRAALGVPEQVGGPVPRVRP